MKPASLCLVLLLALGACKSADPTAAVPSGAGAGDGAGDGSASTAAPADSGSLSDVAPADSADATDAIAAALQRVVDKGAYRVTMSAARSAASPMSPSISVPSMSNTASPRGSATISSTTKNKKTTPGKLEFLKYDPKARKHVAYKEVKLK